MSKILILDVDRAHAQATEEYLKSQNLAFEVTTSVEAAKSRLTAESFDIFFCDLHSIGSFENFAVLFPQSQLVLLLTDTLERHYSEVLNYANVKYIVSCSGFDSGTCERAFKVSKDKILGRDIFGASFYFRDGFSRYTATVTSSRQRHELKDEMMEWLKTQKVRSSVSDRMFTVAEELLMNSIYDAPTDSHGCSLYNHLSRKEEVKLPTAEQSLFECCVDSCIAGVMVTDPFGALPSDLILQYLKTCYEGTPGVLNHGKGGAGRGLHQIIENSDVTVFNVQPGQKTQVICLFSLEKPGALPPPTFHYFRQD